MDVPAQVEARRESTATPAASTAGHERPDLLTAYVPPRDAVEEQLAALWVELLATEPVGIHDSFLELGGNSLMATDLAYRVRALFGRSLPLQDFFAAPTVAGLAELLRREQSSNGNALLSCPGESELGVASA